MSKGNRGRVNRKSRAPQPNGSRTTPMPSMVDADQTAGSRQSSAAFTSHNPTWWTDATEWLRGKGELLWENRLVPFLTWLGAVPERLFGAWGARTRLPRRRLRGSSLGEWSWDDHGVRVTRQVGRFVMVAGVIAVAVLLISALAVHVASALAKSPTSLNKAAVSQPATPTPTPNPAITIHVNNGGFTPPPAPAYTMGMWTSDNSPGVGGSVTVYARISQQGGLPVPDIAVSFSVYGHSESVKTDADGIAKIIVNASSGSNQPVLIDGTATVSGLNMTAETFFTPI